MPRGTFLLKGEKELHSFLLYLNDLKIKIRSFQLADHINALSTDSVSVQVYVCAKMRAKIVSEVNVNIDLLQVCPDFVCLEKKKRKSKVKRGFLFALCITFHQEMFHQVYGYSGEDLPRGQPGKFAYVLSKVELLEERWRHSPGGG